MPLYTREIYQKDQQNLLRSGRTNGKMLKSLETLAENRM